MYTLRGLLGCAINDPHVEPNAPLLSTRSALREHFVSEVLGLG